MEPISAKTSDRSLEQLAVDTIRTLSIDSVQRANSGHPGLPMGMADAAYVLWTKYLKHNPRNPKWPNRDRFVLSAGHGSMLLYSLLHLTGYDLPLEELKNFRQWGSRTPGHPEYGLTPGVETTTGPLGQGFANGVGMAIAEAFLAATFNRPGHRLVDHYTYAIVSDGDLMEGISHEAASLAGHLKLGKLIFLYDDNHISIDGSTDLAYTEDRIARFEAYGWHTQQVDGHNRADVAAAIEAAQAETGRPSLIACRTIIGFGSPHKADSAKAHGEPLGEEEVRLTKEVYGWDPDKKYYIPQEVLSHFRRALEAGGQAENSWQETLHAYRRAHPGLAEQLDLALAGELPDGWEEALPVFQPDAKGMATRASSGKVLNALAAVIPNLLGGSADLAGSNKTMLDGLPAFGNDSFAGRNFYFGVREHGMAGILNGMVLHGGVIPYGGTFLVFSDYCRPSLRLAALSHITPILVFTHDSIGLGEDGPTHQPIEHLMALRVIPNMTVIRPADANEVAQAWRFAVSHKGGPVALVLTRQNMPTFDRREFGPADGLLRGAYVLAGESEAAPDVILIASGSEVSLAVDAYRELVERGVSARVVSMPSWELFAAQPLEYRERVLPPAVTARLAVEAGVTLGWQKYVGDKGRILGLDRFGASAPYERIYQELGLTVERIVENALEMRAEREK